MMKFAKQTSPIFQYKLKSRKCPQMNLQKFKRNYFKSFVSRIHYSIKIKPAEFVINKLKQFVKNYEDFSGVTEVRLAQNKVIKSREELIKAQNNRIVAYKQLNELHNKLKSVYIDLDNTKRGERKYLLLITEEQNLLRKEEEYKVKLREAESEERQQFDAFSNAVNISHEKEKAQSQRTKYWSIIGSILGTVIGIIGSSINNYFKMCEMKRMIQQSINIDFSNQFEAQMQETKQAVKKIIEFQKNTAFNVINRQEKDSLQNCLDKIGNRLMGLEKILNNSCCSRKIKLCETDHEHFYFNSSIASPKKETDNIKYFLISASVLLVAIPIISKLFF